MSKEKTEMGCPNRDRRIQMEDRRLVPRGHQGVCAREALVAFAVRAVHVCTIAGPARGRVGDLLQSLVPRARLDRCHVCNRHEEWGDPPLRVNSAVLTSTGVHSTCSDLFARGASVSTTPPEARMGYRILQASHFSVMGSKVSVTSTGIQRPRRPHG